MSLQLIEFGLEDKKLIKKFVKFAWQHYKNEKFYVPQLNGELLGNRLLGMKGLMTPEHTYHENAEVRHWLAYRDKQIVGRVAGSINHAFNRHTGSKVGSFSFFESINDFEVAKALLDAVASWLRGQGMEQMRGPGQYSNATHEIQGCLMDNFHDIPCVETIYNYPYYATLYEKFGMQKVKDYHAYMMSTHVPFIEREERLMDMIRRRTGATTRCLNLKNMKEEVGKIVSIYNEAWKENWGFIPITQGEADIMAETLALVAVPELIRFAMVDGKEVAVTGFLPDLNEVLQRRKSIFGNSDIVRLVRLLLGKSKVERYKFFFLGVIPEFQKSGLDALVAFEVRQVLPKVRPHARRVEASLLLEDNDAIINLTVRRALAHRYKNYRIYQIKL